MEYEPGKMEAAVLLSPGDCNRHFVAFASVWAIVCDNLHLPWVVRNPHVEGQREYEKADKEERICTRIERE